MGLFSRYSQAAIEKHFPEIQSSQIETPKVTPKAAVEVSAEDAALDISLKQVVDAHSDWKIRLQNVLNGTSDEQFDIEVVSQDCNCFLGRWIYSKGKNRFGHMREYEVVRTAHAEFHQVVGEVLTEHRLGNTPNAETMLKTKFRSASNRNQMELIRLFDAAKAQSPSTIF